MTFRELEIGAYFTFSPGYIQYEKTSETGYKTRHALTTSFFKIKNVDSLVNEIN
jgi:hypothetical protein